jgi:putative transposase
VELRERICEIAALKRRYGYRRIHIKLRREGWTVNPQADLSAVSRRGPGGATAQA